MWQERFMGMQAKVDKFLKAYKQDFEVDKTSILEAPDDTFLWMLRETGTQLVNMTLVKQGEINIKDTALYYFYQLKRPCQFYLVNAGRLERLTQKRAEQYFI